LLRPETRHAVARGAGDCLTPIATDPRASAGPRAAWRRILTRAGAAKTKGHAAELSDAGSSASARRQVPAIASEATAAAESRQLTY
jgi:hypothetical protein